MLGAPPHSRPRHRAQREDEPLYDEGEPDMERMLGAADRYVRRPIPSYDQLTEWEHERAARMTSPLRRYAPPPPPPPALGISDTVLEILVGDLAPQVRGGLNFIAGNSMAQSALTMGAIAAVGLVGPRLMK